MTLAICTLTSSGIVLTADSRQTYKNQAGAVRTGSNSAMKVFRLTSSCGVAISGRAFLNEPNQAVKDAGFFINTFARAESLAGLATKEIAGKLNTYLAGLFVSRDFEAVEQFITAEVAAAGGRELVFAPADGNGLPYSYKDATGQAVMKTWWIDTIHMIISGIDSDGVGRAYSVVVPKGIVAERDTQQCGALWVGQTDVLCRIVLGYAPEIHNLDFVKAASAGDATVTTQQLNKLEYIINWGTITLQDAIDLCVLLTRTTESIQRFSDGTALAPGGIAGVGGEIDIAVITPENGFNWLKRKALSAEGSELAFGLGE